MRDWARSQAASRDASEVAVMQELAGSILQEVVCRSREVVDAMVTVKRMMATDAAI